MQENKNIYEINIFSTKTRDIEEIVKELLSKQIYDIKGDNNE